MGSQDTLYGPQEPSFNVSVGADWLNNPMSGWNAMPTNPNASIPSTESIYGLNGGSGPLYDPGTGAVVGASTGSKLFGWLNLGNNIAQTVIGATRSSQPVYPRPGTTQKLAQPASPLTWIAIAGGIILAMALIMRQVPKGS